MLIVFSSDPYFEKIFKTLLGQGLKIVCLVSEPPKKQGRGLKVQENPAHNFAKKIGLEVITTEKLDRSIAIKIKNIISRHKVKLGLIFGYGKIIPLTLIKAFPNGIINIHPSLLPKYRGPSPIQTALLKGDKQSGFSIILLDEGCDRGPMLFQKKLSIQKNDDFFSLKEKILNEAIFVLPEVIEKYLRGKIPPIPQREAGASLTFKISKEEAEIKKTDSSQRALRKIRAFAQWPRAYFEINGKRIIVHQAKIENNKLIILQIQLEGKKKISFEEFKRGYSHLLTKMPVFVKF